MQSFVAKLSADYHQKFKKLLRNEPPCITNEGQFLLPIDNFCATLQFVERNLISFRKELFKGKEKE